MNINTELQLAKAGNQSAFTAICQHCASMVKKYANRSHIANLKEDALSVGYLAVAEAINSYNHTTGVPFLAFVELKVKFAVWNLFKKERRIWQTTISYDTPTTDDNDTTGNLLDCLADQQLVEDLALTKLTTATVYLAIAALPARQQLVITGLLQGLHQTELANQLGISPQAIHQLKKKAQQGLKKSLSGM